MNKSYLLKITILLLASLCFAACAVKLPVISHYTLATPSLVEHSQTVAHTKSTILINQPNAAPGYDSNRIVYTRDGLQLQSYPTAQWIASPAQMMTQIMAQAVRNKNYFYAVLTPPFAGSSGFRLESRLMLFQQEYQPNLCSQVHLMMWVGLVDESEQERVIATHVFNVFVPAKADVYSGVLAANQAVSLMSRQMARFVVQSMTGL